MKTANLGRTYFGYGYMLKFLASVYLSVKSNALVPALERAGPCEMLIHGHELRWAVANPVFIDEIITRQCYTPNDSFAILPYWTVVDAGANIGTFAIYAASQALDGMVFALEPNVYLSKLLKTNVKCNGFTNVKVLDAALSNREGMVDFGLIPSGGSIMKGYAQNAVNVSVKTYDIDSLISSVVAGPVDLLKLDIEGAEFETFGDFKSSDSVARIAMEVHPSYGDISRLIRLLEYRGFDVKRQPAYLNENFTYLYAIKKHLLD